MSVYCKDDGRGRGLKILENLEAGGDCYLGLKQGSAACLGTEPVVTYFKVTLRQILSILPALQRY